MHAKQVAKQAARISQAPHVASGKAIAAKGGSGPPWVVGLMSTW